MNKKIIVIGSINMDLVVYTDRHPEMGETVFGKQFSRFAGGKGANQAVAMARLGANVQMIGKVGEDEFGETLLTNLSKNGIDTHSILASHNTTGTAFITVDAKGQNSIVVVSGANSELSPVDIDDFTDEIKDADLLVMQLEIPMETVIHAAKLAHENGVQVILNPAPATELPPELLAQIDWIVPNESELAGLSGKPVSSLKEIRLAAEALKQKGCTNVLVTMGERGVFANTADSEVVFPSYKVQAVDTTAAGDAFIGGFATALAEGHSVEAALEMGCASGGLAVTKQGAQSSLPSREDVNLFLKHKLS